MSVAWPRSSWTWSRPGPSEAGPCVRSFDGLPCDDERATTISAVHPVAATLAVGTFTLPRLRFLLQPDVAPHLGTEVLAAPS